MNFYENRILPHVIHFVCGSRPVLEQRKKILPHAEGQILEVGMGSGINIPFYDPNKVEKLWGLEPSIGMRKKAKSRVDAAQFDLEWLGLRGEEVPLDDNSIDTVVLTYTLCTIPGWHDAVKQMRRVLKPGGKLLFSEHGKAPDERVATRQTRINPLWNKIAGGCHLNRDIPQLLRAGGFTVRKMDAQYVAPLPKIAGYIYTGYAD